MADDLDDLLDDAERSFLNKKQKPKPMSSAELTYPPVRASQSHKQKPKNNSDLDDLINDICDIPAMPEPCEVSPRDLKSDPLSSSFNGDSRRKCYGPFLSGAATQFGLSTTAHQRACDRLRCTDCDFQVSVFEDFKWTSETDYLFLRNNMPDYSRLKSNLTQARGWRAYACQCKWRNINTFIDVNKDKVIKWVCGRH